MYLPNLGPLNLEAIFMISEKFFDFFGLHVFKIKIW